MPLNTETLDKLYLEISQFTSAKTGKELGLERELKRAVEDIKDLELELRKMKVTHRILDKEVAIKTRMLTNAYETIKTLRT